MILLFLVVILLRAVCNAVSAELGPTVLCLGRKLRGETRSWPDAARSPPDPQSFRCFRTGGGSCWSSAASLVRAGVPLDFSPASVDLLSNRGDASSNCSSTVVSTSSLSDPWDSVDSDLASMNSGRLRCGWFPCQTGKMITEYAAGKRKTERTIF